jgi:hypothetical protein
MVLTLAAITADLVITVIVLTIAFIAMAVLAMRSIDGDSGPEESDDPGSGGGGGGGGDRTGPSSGRGGDPAWWPEFERELHRYAARPGHDRGGTGAGARSVA